MQINKMWHEKHRMPKNPALIERVNWHLQHSKHCACRPVPASVVAAIKSKDWKICNRGHRYSGVGPCPVCWPGRKRATPKR